MTITEIFKKIENTALVPVAVIDDAGASEPLARALFSGGLGCIEITMRTPAALEAMRIVSSKFPEMLVGAGTVLSVSQAQAAIESGAKFVVSPGFNAQVAEYCMKKNVPIVPGVLTPTEIGNAISLGLDKLKFFPAESYGGVNTLKALSAPFGGVKFMPTGGISSDNLKGYLKLGCVFACGGSFMVSASFIKNGEYEKIRDISKRAVENILSLEPCALYAAEKTEKNLPSLDFDALIKGVPGNSCAGLTFNVETDFFERAVFHLAQNSVITDEAGMLNTKFCGANIKLIQR